MKLLRKFRIFKGSKTATENNKSKEINLGCELSYCNPDLGLEVSGTPKEIVDEFHRLGINLDEISRLLNTIIVAYPVIQKNPYLEIPDGPQGENLTQLLDLLEAREFKTAERLLRDKPTVLAEDFEGASIPLIAYATKGDVEIVDFLLNHGALPNLPGYFALTPLHWAAAGGHADVVVSLISAGADPIALGWLLHTPAETAALNGYQEIAETIRQSCPEFYEPDLWMAFHKRMGHKPISTGDNRNTAAPSAVGKFTKERSEISKHFELEKYDIGEADLWYWRTVCVESEDSTLIIRVRIEKPKLPDLEEYNKCVSITWKYIPGPKQLPVFETNEKHEDFERALDDLTKYNNLSFLVGVSTGMGYKEWVFYVKDNDEFIHIFNERLSYLPRYPIEIEFYDDPAWEIWREKVEFYDKSKD